MGFVEIDGPFESSGAIGTISRMMTMIESY
jgi:hypothetical protein